MKNALTRLAAVVAAGLMVAGLAACGHHSASTARAKASVSALATSPAVVAAEKKAIAEVTSCAKSVAGLTISIPLPGSSIPPTVSGLSLSDVRHPLKTLEAIGKCTPAGRDHGTAMKICAEAVLTRNGFGHGVLAKDIADLATSCVAGVK